MGPRKREALEGYLYLTPWAIGFVVFVGGPMLVSLSFQLGQQNYDVDIATKYVEFLLLTDNDMTVLIVDSGRHFVAMTEGTTMLTLLRNQGQQIRNALATANSLFFITLPGFHTNSIKATDSNATALEKMRAAYDAT